LPRNVPHTLAWPSRSPNLNPMKNVWKILKRNVRKSLPETIMELEDCRHEEWNNLDNKMIFEFGYKF